MGQAPRHRRQRIEGGTRPHTGRDHAQSIASPREVLMTARRIVMLVALAGALTGMAHAAETAEGPGPAAHGAATGGASSVTTAVLDSGAGKDLQPAIPWISHTMPESVQEKLQTAYDIAVTRVREVPQCAGLFSSLDAAGSEALTRTLYYPANPHLEKKLCRGASAFTRVGVSQTYVCRRYSSLNTDYAAMLLVHEALHHAGLTERPQDRRAMSSKEINEMVTEACGF
jgi:hypothetical protein